MSMPGYPKPYCCYDCFSSFCSSSLFSSYHSETVSFPMSFSCKPWYLLYKHTLPVMLGQKFDLREIIEISRKKTMIQWWGHISFLCYDRIFVRDLKVDLKINHRIKSVVGQCLEKKKQQCICNRTNVLSIVISTRFFFFWSDESMRPLFLSIMALPVSLSLSL